MSAPFRVSILLDAKDKGARAAVKGLGDEARKTGADVDKLGTASERAGKQTAGTRAHIEQTGKAYDGASRHIGTMTSQFNDLIVGLQMGQNPITLATQQGLQITQIFDQMGRGTSVFPLLGRAAMTLISPMNLITLGSIAAGAAVFKLAKGFFSARSDAQIFETAITEANDSLSNLQSLAQSFDGDALAKKYGRITAEVLGLVEAQRLVEDMVHRAKIEAAIEEIAKLNDTGGVGGFFAGLRGGVDADVRAVGRALDLTLGQAQLLTDALDKLETAQGVERQAEAAGELRQILVSLIAVVGSGNDELNTMLANVIAVEDNARQLVATSEDLDDALGGAGTAAERLAAIDLAANIARATSGAHALRDALAAAQTASLSRQQQIGVLTAQIGAARSGSSVSAAEARVTTATMLSGSGMSLDAMAAKITQAEQEAAQIEALRAELGTLTRPARSGGARGTKAEAEAVRELIASLEQELDATRALDPVQRELIQHREALKNATDAERAAVEDLIRQRLEEEQATERAKERAREFSQITYDAITSLIFEAESLSDVIDNLALALAQAALQGALLGQGPFAGMFGMGEGGALGMIFGSLFGAVGKAEGGMVYGRGSGTSDSVPINASNGEFVVNAAATARNRQLLERINAGADAPGFASGGYIGPSGPSPMGAGGQVNITIENRSSAQVAGEIEEVASQSGQRAMKLVLADQVGAALTQAGGGAKRALQSRYGVRQVGTRR